MKLQEAVELQKEALLKTLQESIRIRSVEDTPAEDAPYGMGIRDCLVHALQTAMCIMKMCIRDSRRLYLRPLAVPAASSPHLYPK